MRNNLKFKNEKKRDIVDGAYHKVSGINEMARYLIEPLG